MKKYLLSIVLALSIQTSMQVMYGADINSFFTLHPTTSNTHSATYKDKDYTYYQGGNIRIYNEPTQTIQPISITPPSISAGCSGIDLKMGGVAFANAQKYENFAKQVLKSAPYVATQMAIKALSSETADTIAEFQALVDRLNSMQLDSCAAAQGLVTATVALSTDSEAAISSARNKSDEMVGGMADAFIDLKKAIGNDVSRIFTGYDSDIKEYDSLLLKINRRVPFPAGYDINEIRGMVGDMGIGATSNNNVPFVSGHILDNCEGSKFNDVYTASYTKTNNNVGNFLNCTRTSAPPLADISNAILNNTQPTQAVLAFLNAIRQVDNFYNNTEFLAKSATENKKQMIGLNIDQEYNDVSSKFPYLVVVVDANILLKHLELYRQAIIKGTSNANKNMDLYVQYMVELDRFKAHILDTKSIAQKEVDSFVWDKQQQRLAKNR